jgi:gamma-aminobutyric acid type B receptor
MPTWEERIYNPTTTGSEWAMFALAIVGIIFSISLMFVVIANRKNKIIRASSVIFLVYVLFGTCLSYASIFTWNLSWLDRAACVLTPLLLGIGFTITFGCLFAKSWRIHSLYNDKRLTIKAITDGKLSIITAVVVGIEAIICIIIAIFGSEPQLIVTDPFRPALWYTDCNVNMTATPIPFAFIIIALGYNAILMGYGIYLAVRIRSVPHKVYNESRLLAFVIYVLVIISALITALQFVSTISREERFIIRSIGIFVANVTTVVVVFGNKIHLMLKLKKGGDDGTNWTNKNTTAMTSSNPQSSSGLSEQHSSKLENEVNDLRREIDKLKTENDFLKSQKEGPKDKPAASSSDETTEK